MSGIYLANANEKKTNSKSKKKKKKIWKPKLKVLTISMNVRRCEAFMNSNMLRKRLQIEAKMYSLFSTIYSHIFFLTKELLNSSQIMSFSIQPIMPKSLWRQGRCFRCTLMTFFPHFISEMSTKNRDFSIVWEFSSDIDWNMNHLSGNCAMITTMESITRYWSDS